MSDPIANLVTSINNATSNSMKLVCVPSSRYKESLLSVLRDKKVVADYKKIKKNNIELIQIELNNQHLRLKRISKSGRRLYSRSKKLKNYKDGFLIISTPEGVMTQNDAFKKGIGGEIIMEVL